MKNTTSQESSCSVSFNKVLFIPVEELCGKSNFRLFLSHEESEQEEVSLKAEHQIALNYDNLVYLRLR